MADTLARGLSGQTLEGYRYCAGEAETARRKRQIENHTKGFPVWEGRKLKSWKALDASAKRQRKVATVDGSASKRSRAVAAVLGAVAMSTPSVPPAPVAAKPKRMRRNSMGGGGS